MKPLPYALLQCVWGAPQTLAGLALRLRFRRCPRRRAGGCVLTLWPRDDGVSLGLFVFAPADGSLTAHEYGHTVQSLLLGPLYLPVVGLPSALWASLPAFRRLRRRRGLPYSACFTERWADALGARCFPKEMDP